MCEVRAGTSLLQLPATPCRRTWQKYATTLGNTWGCTVARGSAQPPGVHRSSLQSSANARSYRARCSSARAHAGGVRNSTWRRTVVRIRRQSR
eukprot:1771142-Alexandrium_andersonii.AAC.1